MYVPNMKSLESTMSQGALYTYLVYISEHIWLSYYKYSSHSKHNVHIDPGDLFIYVKLTQTAMSASHSIAKYVPEIYMPTKLGKYAMCPNIRLAYMGDVETSICHI